VPPGTTERIAYPIIKQAFATRGLTGSRKPVVSSQKSEGAPG
jgi:hypothetical protein